MAISKDSDHYARQLFARNLKILRLKKKLTQEELAHHAGIHRTYASSVELGNRNISVDNIGRIAKALGCDIREFFDPDLGEPNLGLDRENQQEDSP